jgi:NADH dehydrogenase (ubiquinone) Fe-S protein 3
MNTFQNNIVLLNYKQYISNVFPNILGFFINNELIIKSPISYIKKLIFFLEKHTNSQYHILIDMTAADYPNRKNRFELIYNLLSIKFNSRLTLSSFIAEMTVIPSIVFIHEGAG